MLFTQKLKEKIGEEAFNKLKQELEGKEIYLLEPKDYITKETFNKTLKEKKELETSKGDLEKQLTEANDKVKKMEETGSQTQKTVEEQIAALTGKIESLENTNKEKDTELEREKRTGILKDHLNKAKVNPIYLKHAMNEFNVNDLKIKDGAIEGFDELLKPVQETYPDFFGENKLSGNSPAGGNGAGGGSDEVKEQTTEEFIADVFSGEVTN